jgi:arsenite methyltransferase
MKTESCQNLFEQLSGQPFTAAGIRPGGLDLTRRAVSVSQLAPGDDALDMGCGTGVTVEYLLREHGIEAVGVDSSSVLVAQGKGKDGTLPLLRGDAQILPFAAETFDGVFLECTLSLVLDREQVLQECHRVLRPVGRIIVTDLYARNRDAIKGLRSLPVRSCLQGALDKDQFFHECSAGGFDFVCFEDHSDLLRDFAARMIWEYGSLDRFWTQAGGCGTHPGEVRDSIRAARPGYFLFAGRRNGRKVSGT